MTPTRSRPARSTGPLNIPLNAKVHTVKELVVAEWPEDKVGKPAPDDPREVRLIHNGKVMEPGKTLADCKVAVAAMGNEASTDGFAGSHCVLLRAYSSECGR